MGNSKSRQQNSPNVKLNKDHKKDKIFRVGLSFGRGDLSMDGHFQMGYVSKTKKVYARSSGVAFGTVVEGVDQGAVETSREVQVSSVTDDS